MFHSLKQSGENIIELFVVDQFFSLIMKQFFNEHF